jgi:hypothetical protein
MCTVSWLARAGGYELFCNRDERRARKAALLPSVGVTHGVRFVAPTDGEAGGTWIGVNEHGLTLCLLNRYAAGEVPGACDFQSRGLLLPDLLSRRDPIEVTAAVARAWLRQFQPFTLLALAPGPAASVVSWTGRRLLVAEDDCDSLMPLTSSSFAGAEATRVRRELFRSMTAGPAEPAPELHERYHRSHSPGPGPLSVCMHRLEASTVSFSRVRVNTHSAEFFYQPGPPCAGAQGVRVSLPRPTGRLAWGRETARWDRSGDVVL